MKDKVAVGAVLHRRIYFYHYFLFVPQNDPFVRVTPVSESTLTILSSRFCFWPAVTQSDIDQQWRARFGRDAVDCLWAGVILGKLACAVRARLLLGLSPLFA